MASGVERASTGAHNVINKVSEAAHPALDRISSGAHHGVDKAASAVTRTAAMFNEKREKLKYAQARTMEGTRNYVRANPITSVGIALAAGYLISRLFQSRKG
ncbi:MAG: hypothetical protein ABI648_02285 [Betaproteobacteria bacterium]|jgi:ElaB/YqjD/DUF883 family membrane-anchored ribosome-binding protein